MTLLRVEGLKAYYLLSVHGVQQSVKAVDGVSFEIKQGENLGIAGESGCGKSTLLKVLCGMAKPPLVVLGGRVQLASPNDGLDILNIQEELLRTLRWKAFSYIPQGSMSVLNPVRRVEQTFADIIVEKEGEKGRHNYYPFIRQHLESLGLPTEVLKSYPHQLSGGMRQRVVIALATIFAPSIIFADEPTSALDVVSQRGILDLFRKIQYNHGSTFLFVTHDIAVLSKIADSIAIMYAGRIVEVGKVKEVLKNPLHPYTRYLVSSLPRVGDKSLRVSAPGNPPSLLNPPGGCRFHTRCPFAIPGRCDKHSPKMIRVEIDHSVSCFLFSEEEDARDEI